MNSKLWLKGIAITTIALGSITAIPSTNLAQVSSYRYYCGTSADGIPTTYASPPSGRKVAVIRWQRDWGGQYTPEVRCQQVSAKFQQLAKEGYLNYLTAGVKNGQKVVCGVKRYGDTCEKVLFTLRSTDDPNKVIQDLIGLGAKASGPLVQSEDGAPQEYYDMNLFLEIASTEAQQ